MSKKWWLCGSLAVACVVIAISSRASLWLALGYHHTQPLNVLGVSGLPPTKIKHKRWPWIPGPLFLTHDGHALPLSDADIVVRINCNCMDRPRQIGVGNDGEWFFWQIKNRHSSR